MTLDAVAPPQPPRISSPARIAANRRNAQRSTGPTTELGKLRSRRNALTHGLTATSERFAADDARQARRRDALVETLDARTEVAAMLCDQLAHASIQVERAAAMVRNAVEAASIRAEDRRTWAEDRRLDAAKTAETLSRDPEKAVAALLHTPQGVDWLADRWRFLLMAAEHQRGWTEEQADLAFDLMRTPPDYRHVGPLEAHRALEGPDDAPSDLAALARRMIDRLDQLRDHAEEHDEVARLSTVHEVSDRQAPEVRRLRRYEAAIHRRFRWLAEWAGVAPAARPARNEPVAEPTEAAKEPATPSPEAKSNPTPPPTRPATEVAEPARPGIPTAKPATGNRPDPARPARRHRKDRRRRRSAG